MRKKISREWLEAEGACEDGIAWWEEHGDESVDGTLRQIHTRPDYAHWLIRRLIGNDKPMAVNLAVFSARLCLDNHSGDKAPLIAAIEAAEEVLKNDCKETRTAAEKATRAASRSATRIATRSAALCLSRSAPWHSARSASRSAAWSARNAAESAADSARNAVESAESAQSAAWSAWSARCAAWREILDELIRLRMEEEGEQNA